ncbi:MAG: hypothetical protein ACRES5_34385, partial [Pseudomonas sp.]
TEPRLPMGLAFRYSCSDCGDYRISTTLDAMIGEKVFDIERTRVVLRFRRRQIPAEEPTLSSDDRDLLIDPE